MAVLEEIDDNLVVITYLQLGSMLYGASKDKIVMLIKYIENII